MRAVKTSDRASALMIDNDEENARAPSINWFLVDQEIPVREMFQLALDNWIAAQSFGAYGRLELTILSHQLLEDAREMQEYWTIASRCAV